MTYGCSRSSAWRTIDRRRRCLRRETVLLDRLAACDLALSHGGTDRGRFKCHLKTRRLQPRATASRQPARDRRDSVVRRLRNEKNYLYLSLTITLNVIFQEIINKLIAMRVGPMIGTVILCAINLFMTCNQLHAIN